MFNFFKKKNQYETLPDRHFSYVTGENGEPLVTFFHPASNLFINVQFSDTDGAYFLNIRRPIVIDVYGGKVTIPDLSELPKECDGIIFKNVGDGNFTAFYVLDRAKQSMRCT